MQNFFPQGAGGHITFVSSRDWRFDPQNLSFKMATNEKMTQRFVIELRDKANSGRQSVRVDFDMNVDERYQFSVYRHIDVGLGDVEIRLSTSLSKTKGHLIVRQEMINYSNRIVDFKCTLQAPGRRRMRTQVIRLAKGKDVKTYRIGNGRELIGQMLRLRAEEMEGQRVLKYTVIAKE
jgi:hypothetical protein